MNELSFGTAWANDYTHTAYYIVLVPEECVEIEKINERCGKQENLPKNRSVFGDLCKQSKRAES